MLAALVLPLAPSTNLLPHLLSKYPVVVDLPNGDGKLEGLGTPLHMEFHSVPFAEPPTKTLRWMPPVKNVPWRGKKQATEWSANCAQTHYKHIYNPGINATFSEDCLYLNIYAPPPPIWPNKLHAVWVYLSGDDFSSGGADDDEIYGIQAVKEMQDVVVVVPNYRQGIFGGLASRELQLVNQNATGDRSTGNFGLQDQQMALRWVSENIKAFGGDPSRVLLFGASSGACDVSAHLVSRRSRGLFSRAAMQSCSFTHWGSKTLAEGQSNFDYFVNITGCNASSIDVISGNSSNATLVDRATTVVRCLQNIRERELQNLERHALLPLKDSWTTAAYAPTIDGEELTADPAELLKRAAKEHNLALTVAPVPVLLGSNTNEGSAFVSLCRSCDDYVQMSADYTTYQSWTSTTFAGRWARKVQAQYNMEKYLPFWAACQATGDFLVRCPARRAAMALEQAHTHPERPAEGAFGGRGRVFAYDFTHSPTSSKLTDGGPCGAGDQGAFHGAEIPFVFHINRYLKTPPELVLSGKMSRFWRNFAYSGDPNVPPATAREDPTTQSLPHWPAFTVDSDQTMQLGSEPDGNVAPAVARLRVECAMWDECEQDPACWAADPTKQGTPSIDASHVEM